MKIIIKIIFVLVLFISPYYPAFASSYIKSDASTCSKIRKLIKLDMQHQYPEHYPAEFKNHFVDYTNPNMDDISAADIDTYKDLDIDNDGEYDAVERSCSGSTNPRTCFISVRLSSDDKDFDNEFLASYITRYKSEIYVVEEFKNIYLISKNGFKEICKKYNNKPRIKNAKT